MCLCGIQFQEEITNGLFMPHGQYFPSALTVWFLPFFSTFLLFLLGCTVANSLPFLLQKLPELKFKYVEEEQPEEFFIPYVWSLVYNAAVALYWNPRDIQLFTMDSG